MHKAAEYVCTFRQWWNKEIGLQQVQTQEEFQRAQKRETHDNWRIPEGYTQIALTSFVGLEIKPQNNRRNKWILVLLK